MVGIVLVSHSADLASAVKALADQQTQGKAAMAAVGGTGDPEHPFGTDAMAILEAIQSVYSDDGVLVLMDLGSALMSTEMAIEFMDEAQRPHVRMSQAPFVEGAMAAAVQASIGMDLDAVASEARDALGPKAESVAEEPAMKAAAEPAGEGAKAAPEELVGTAKLINPAGLHFGPAVLFVQTAARYPQTSIKVRNLTTGAGPVDARRFNQVMGLGAENGHDIEIRAQGPDAEAAVKELVDLSLSGFGEAEQAPEASAAPTMPSPAAPPPSAAAATEAAAPVAAEATKMVPPEPAIAGRGRLILRGIPASPGVALGTAYSLTGFPTGAGAELTGVQPVPSTIGAEAEATRYQDAAARAKKELIELAGRIGRELGAERGRIFQAHALLLDDPDWTDAVMAGIQQRELTAESAVAAAAQDMAAHYEAMSGARFRERATDVRDVGARVVQLLRSAGVAGDGAGRQTGHLPVSAVVVAEDLAPSQTAGLDRSRVVAFCTAFGGATAHTAILARGMGIPAVVGLGLDNYVQIPAGASLAVDGSAGVVIVDPDEETEAAYWKQQAEERRIRDATWNAAHGPAHTQDGRRVEVVANLATAADARAALAAGAEGVGLLRTEFLFQDRSEAPTEEEQYQAYREVVEIMAPRPVVIRTLDIGGDKPAPYLPLPQELNPFLGWRAIRVSLAMPDFFKVQLRAILRAATSGNVLVMFPMVALRSEVVQARALLAEAARELVQSGVPHRDQVPTGIMVEVPAAAETPDLLAPVVDFFSIGTNDLTQYTFAADRGNANVSRIGDPLHPAVLRQIGRVIDAAHAEGKWVGLCGELAGQPAAVPVLLGLGLDEFSMAAGSIPGAKGILGRLTVPEAETLARRVLSLPDGTAVRAAVEEAMGSGE